MTADDGDLRAAEYVLGTLDAEERRVFDRQLEFDPSLQAAVREWEERLGKLAEVLTPIQPPESLWQSIERRLEDDSIPGTTTVREGEGDWEPIAAGVELKLLYANLADGCRSFLLRMAPGSMVPGHAHPKTEECLVLEGEMIIGTARFAVGDYHAAPPDVDHPDISTEIGTVVFVRGALEDHAEASPH